MTGTALPEITDRDVLVRTRHSWHAVAEHVLAPARHRAEGRIGLRVTEGGFGTPELPSGVIARVAGNALVVTGPDQTSTTPLTTVAAACAVLGIEPGAPLDVYTPTTPLEPEAALMIDDGAAGLLAAWFTLGWTTLEGLVSDASESDGASPPTLWPEHFDAATELGQEARGTRGGFGVSPGDDAHPEPYLYVTHWADVRSDPFWNDTAFPGASLGYDAVVSDADPASTMRAFFERGRVALGH